MRLDGKFLFFAQLPRIAAQVIFCFPHQEPGMEIITTASDWIILL